MPQSQRAAIKHWEVHTTLHNVAVVKSTPTDVECLLEKICVLYRKCVSIYSVTLHTPIQEEQLGPKNYISVSDFKVKNIRVGR